MSSATLIGVNRDAEYVVKALGSENQIVHARNAGTAAQGELNLK
ncbi:MAG TPA: hypothetical protein VH601_02005 [Bryobacteraceae bacterium]|jgi:hypothetical protein